MAREEIKREIMFAEMVLSAIENLDVPMLVYDGEKDVVKKALSKHLEELKQELIGR